MKNIIMIILFVFSILLIGCTEKVVEDIESQAHICTEEEMNAQICTMDYSPVCGDNDKTYGNACTACSSNEIESYVVGECV